MTRPLKAPIPLPVRKSVTALVREGYDDGEIAAALGISRDRARRIRQALGLAAVGKPGRKTGRVTFSFSSDELLELEAKAGGDVVEWGRGVLLREARDTGRDGRE